MTKEEVIMAKRPLQKKKKRWASEPTGGNPKEQWEKGWGRPKTKGAIQHRASKRDFVRRVGVWYIQQK